MPSCVKLVELLLEWNNAYNLTAIRTPETIVVKHLLDSFSVVEYVQGPRIVDIGTGAGFPGLPMALIQPQRQFWLLDANAKKIQFVRHSIAVLGVENVQAFHVRAEHFKVERDFDTAIARALGSLKLLIELSFPMLKPSGMVLAMKGKYPDKEINDLDHFYEVLSQKIKVPGLNAQRHLITIKHRDRAI